jgi:glycosyltransferase involved in cell wall biosynthesis
MNIAIEQGNTYIKKKDSEQKLNILIRTSNRPEYFKQAIESILNQNYKNYKIYVSYDKKESLEYLKNYNNINIIEMNINNPNKYKFNLYNNYLMDKVEDGYILFLDDDDIYIHNNVFNIINDNLTSNDDFLIWKFMRPDKLIYPNNNIILGTIDTTSFCFHSNFKHLARWGDKQCGDFRFVNSLLRKKNFNIKKIDYILTKTIFENKIASFGN